MVGKISDLTNLTDIPADVDEFEFRDDSEPAGTDAQNKALTFGHLKGILPFKQPVRVATTANGALATAYKNGDTVDGIILATGDRILLKDQTAGSENGIYTVNATGAPTRALDFDTTLKVKGGMVVPVQEGTANADKAFLLTNDGTITIGTTALTFTEFGAGGGGDIVVGTQILEVDASALYAGGAVPATGLVTKQFGAQNQPIRAIQLTNGSNQEVYWQGKLNNWDGGTIKIKAYWFVENDLATPELTTFELDCSGVSLANFAGIGGTAYGTPVTITDTTDSVAPAEDKINISPASTAITIVGAGAGKWVSVKMVRDATTDTAGNVFLAGISIEYTISGGTATI